VAKGRERGWRRGAARTPKIREEATLEVEEGAWVIKELKR
jgi:hypothetical protein